MLDVSSQPLFSRVSWYVGFAWKRNHKCGCCIIQTTTFGSSVRQKDEWLGWRCAGSMGLRWGSKCNCQLRQDFLPETFEGFFPGFWAHRAYVYIFLCAIPVPSSKLGVLGSQLDWSVLNAVRRLWWLFTIRNGCHERQALNPNTRDHGRGKCRISSKIVAAVSFLYTVFVQATVRLVTSQSTMTSFCLNLCRSTWQFMLCWSKCVVFHCGSLTRQRSSMRCVLMRCFVTVAFVQSATRLLGNDRYCLACDRLVTSSLYTVTTEPFPVFKPNRPWISCPGPQQMSLVRASCCTVRSA